MFGASVEAEVGNMGRIAEDGVMLTDAAMYTDPDAAIAFIEKTGVTALAISYGSTLSLIHISRE